MEMGLGELADRFTILTLKRMFLDEAAFHNEWIEYHQAMYLDYPQFAGSIGFQTVLFELLLTNAAIWKLEADIRLGKEGELGLEEVGRRAIAIRDINRRRWQYKNHISECVNRNVEIKSTWQRDTMLEQLSLAVMLVLPQDVGLAEGTVSLIVGLVMDQLQCGLSYNLGLQP